MGNPEKHIGRKNYVQVMAVDSAMAWSDRDSNPVLDIQSLMRDFEREYGDEPDTLVLSKQDLRYLRRHPDIVDRLKYVPEFANIYKVPDVIGRFFGVDLEFHESGHNAPYVYCKGYTIVAGDTRNSDGA